MTEIKLPPLTGTLADLPERHKEVIEAYGKACATAAIEADRQETKELLQNPVHVHANMCRGIIAPITFDQLAHILGEEATSAWLADRQARGEPVAKIDPNPPQLSIVWHDSPESVDRAMWEQSAIEAGITYEELIEVSSVGETEDGEVFEFTHEQAIDGMRTQGCWGFVDTKTNTINAWAADDVDASTVLHMLAHEIGHVTGDPHDDDMQEEMRAEQFGRVAALAYRLWCEKKSDAPQPPQIPEGYRLVPIEPTAWDMEDGGIVEAVTKAILFEDCGSTVDWQDNLSLGEAALRAVVAHTPVEMGAAEWAELHILRAERGPSDGVHKTWKDAAIAERCKRVSMTPRKEIIDLAKEGLGVYTGPNTNEHKICAEIVRLSAMLEAAPEARP